MLARESGGFVRLRRVSVVRINQRIFMAALITLFLGSSVSVQAVTTYNDVWGYEDSEGEAYLVVIGITQTGISEDYHTSFVDTTLMSALGRVTFASGQDEANPDEFPEAGEGGSPSDFRVGRRKRALRSCWQYTKMT